MDILSENLLGALDHKKNKKNKKEYRDYYVKIPKYVADFFCLEKGQDLIFEYDILSRSMKLSVKSEDVADYETWTKRVMGEDLRKNRKSKRKIHSKLKIRICKWINHIEEQNKKILGNTPSSEEKLRKNKELIQMHEKELKKLEEYF